MLKSYCIIFLLILLNITQSYTSTAADKIEKIADDIHEARKAKQRFDEDRVKEIFTLATTNVNLNRLATNDEHRQFIKGAFEAVSVCGNRCTNSMIKSDDITDNRYQNHMRVVRIYTHSALILHNLFSYFSTKSQDTFIDMMYNSLSEHIDNVNINNFTDLFGEKEWFAKHIKYAYPLLIEEYIKSHKNMPNIGVKNEEAIKKNESERGIYYNTLSKKFETRDYLPSTNNLYKETNVGCLASAFDTINNNNNSSQYSLSGQNINQGIVNFGIALDRVKKVASNSIDPNNFNSPHNHNPKTSSNQYTYNNSNNSAQRQSNDSLHDNPPVEDPIEDYNPDIHKKYFDKSDPENKGLFYGLNNIPDNDNDNVIAYCCCLERGEIRSVRVPYKIVKDFESKFYESFIGPYNSATGTYGSSQTRTWNSSSSSSSSGSKTSIFGINL